MSGVGWEGDVRVVGESYLGGMHSSRKSNQVCMNDFP